MTRVFFVNGEYQPLLRMIGLDEETIFTHPDVKPWRVLEDRENCLLDVAVGGQHVKWHVKRYRENAAEPEVRGIELLRSAAIPTVPLVGWGKLHDGRSFVITDDLRGFDAADKLLASGLLFAELLQPSADLTARLHQSGLHHRDLYLCHFFYNSQSQELRLIDTARVRKLPGWPLRSRWIYKDLGQFWYSTQSLPITDDQRESWLQRYATQRGTGLKPVQQLRRAIERVSNRIARHDRRLRRRQPHRNISIPTSP